MIMVDAPGDLHGQVLPLVDMYAGCPATWLGLEVGGLTGCRNQCLCGEGARLELEG